MTRPAKQGMVEGMRFGRWLSQVLLAGWLTAGCGSGTETGNPSLTGTLSYSGYSSQPNVIGVRSPGSVARIDNAWFELEAIEVSADGCGLAASPEFAVPALGVGDHAGDDHNYSEFSAAPGAFCRVLVPFSRVASAANVPQALRGHSFLIEGELADGTPFSLVSDAAPKVVLQSSTAGFMLSSERNHALLTFDVATWLAEMDFEEAEREGDRILISESSNAALLQRFEARLAGGVALYLDRDGDGVLDRAPELLASARADTD